MIRRAILLAPALAFGQATPDEEALQTLEARWDDATLRGDADTMAAIFADGFIVTDGDGVVRTRSEVITAVRSGKLRYHSAKTEALLVKLHGNAAVVSGKWHGSYTHGDKKVELLERFTNFYVKQAGTWRCVASHGSSIPP